VERWMDGWHADGDEDGRERVEGPEREPAPPLLPPRRDDEWALATGASEELGESGAARERRALHRVGGMDRWA
jgi:hypothetical protein